MASSPKRAVGLDLGGTKLMTAVIADDGTIAKLRREDVSKASQTTVLQQIAGAVEAARAGDPDIRAVGLALPGTLDQRTGSVVTSNHLPLRDFPIREWLETRTGLPVAVDNDGNAAAVAETRLGAARGARVTVAITIGTGIGSGVVIDGRSFGGATGAAPEIGHMVLDLRGPPCPGSCRNRGCFEALVSGLALVRRFREAVPRHPLARQPELRGELIAGAAEDGDSDAQDVIREMAVDLGFGLTSVANIFNPDVIVIGGGVSRIGERLLQPAREVLQERALPPMDFTPVRLAELGDQAGMIGAALIALDGARV